MREILPYFSVESLHAPVSASPEKFGLIVDDGHRPTPGAASALYLDGEHRDGEPELGELVEIHEFFRMYVFFLAAQEMTAKEIFRVSLTSEFCHPGDGNVETPCVYPHHLDPPIDKPLRGVYAHARMGLFEIGGVQIFRGVVGADENNVHRLEGIAFLFQARHFLLRFLQRDVVAALGVMKIEDYPITNAPFEGNEVDSFRGVPFTFGPIVIRRIEVRAAVCADGRDVLGRAVHVVGKITGVRKLV